jgi:MFS family permease
VMSSGKTSPDLNRNSVVNEKSNARNEGAAASRFGWPGEVSRYQWLVLIVAWLGWVFDAMDGALFSLVQTPAMTELMGRGASGATIGFYAGVVSSIMLMGWALGGIIFGILADYFGRTKALIITILIYSLFTGLSAFADTWWQLMVFRFITGLGLGGEWAAGAALVAEVWPDRLRGRAGAILQAAGAGGFFLAALVNLLVGVYSWRYVFVMGAAPALLVLLVRIVVKEPESWTRVRDRRRQAKAQLHSQAINELDTFTLKQLFSPALRRDTVVASALAFVGLLGVWGGTMWIPAAIREISAAGTLGLSAAGAQRFLAARASYAMMLVNGGAIVGNVLFGPVADWKGRRTAFFIFFAGAIPLFPITFLLTGNIAIIFVLLPVLGFFAQGVMSGFPIYLPELFPTHVRTTGIGFCYNLGRFLTAGGVFVVGYLVGFFGSYAKAASAVSLVFIIGLVILRFARETGGQALR